MLEDAGADSLETNGFFSTTWVLFVIDYLSIARNP
jgi:hypothetical protein